VGKIDDIFDFKPPRPTPPLLPPLPPLLLPPPPPTLCNPQEVNIISLLSPIHFFLIYIYISIYIGGASKSFKQKMGVTTIDGRTMQFPSVKIII